MHYNRHLALPSFQQFQLPAIAWAHGRNKCFFFLDSCVALEGFACIEENDVMFSLQTKRAIDLMTNQLNAN